MKHASRGGVPSSQPELDLPVTPREVPSRRTRRRSPEAESASSQEIEQPGFDFDEVPDDLPLLNRHGLRAMEHWRHHAPPQHREVAEPRVFFAGLGEELARRTAQLAQPLEQQLDADLPPVERIQRVTEIRSRAEEEALAEQLQLIQQLSLEQESQLAELLEGLPAAELIDEELERIDDQVAQGRELADEGFDGTNAEQVVRHQLHRLRDLLRTVNDPAIPVAQRIQAAEEATRLSARHGAGTFTGISGPAGGGRRRRRGPGPWCASGRGGR